MLRSANDATPPTALWHTVPGPAGQFEVPLNTPPLGFVPIASVIAAVEEVTVFPDASCTRTVTAGVIGLAT